MQFAVFQKVGFNIQMLSRKKAIGQDALSRSPITNSVHTCNTNLSLSFHW